MTTRCYEGMADLSGLLSLYHFENVTVGSSETLNLELFPLKSTLTVLSLNNEHDFHVSPRLKCSAQAQSIVAGKATMLAASEVAKTNTRLCCFFSTLRSSLSSSFCSPLHYFLSLRVNRATRFPLRTLNFSFRVISIHPAFKQRRWIFEL